MNAYSKKTNNKQIFLKLSRYTHHKRLKTVVFEESYIGWGYGNMTIYCPLRSALPMKDREDALLCIRRFFPKAIPVENGTISDRLWGWKEEGERPPFEKISYISIEEKDQKRSVSGEMKISRWSK